MKKFHLAFYTLVLSLVMISCKKTSQVEDANLILPQKSSILNYLTSQKTNNSPTRIKQIEKLSENLLFDKSWVEKSYAHSLIITPIDELYQFSNNKENKVSNYFVCVVDSTSKIVTSYIVQNRPMNNNGKTAIKKDAIANMDDNKPVAEDCNVRFINIYDYYLYEMNYKNNTLVSTLVKNTKSTNNSKPTNQNTTNTSGNCIDWYWQTYVNGVLVSEVYLYTDCGINVEEGGGGGSQPIGISVTRNVDLVVKEITTGSQERWKILGTFAISGVKFTNTADNYFTSISFLDAACINYNPAYDGLPSMLPYFIFSSSNSSGLIGTTLAKGTVNAEMYYPNWLATYGYEKRDHYSQSGFWHASTDLY